MSEVKVVVTICTEVLFAVAEGAREEELLLAEALLLPAAEDWA